MRLAERMSRLGTEKAFEAGARARALEATGRSVIHLEIGEPDFDTPANIVEADKAALDAGWTHYPPAPGLPVLREAIVADFAKRRGTQFDPGQVIITPGAKPVMFFAILALVQAGDEVIYPDPGFPIYESMTRFAGATPVPIPIRQENDFRLDPDELARLVTPRTKLIIFNSPANPTGGVLTREDLEAIARIAVANDIMVLADEIYGRIVYEGEHISITTLPGMAERTIVLDGFSKTYAMTGWRMGHAIVPQPLVEPFTRLVINSVSGTSAHQQLAAAEALNGPQDAVDEMVEEFRARRDLIVDGLNSIPGVNCVRPHGAFYVFPDMSGTGRTGPELEERFLLDAGVSVLSGTAFGQVGANHLRISYANSRENISIALDRMRSVLAPLTV
jgi:aspartate/methionine/tyrosine aminotransferase